MASRRARSVRCGKRLEPRRCGTHVVVAAELKEVDTVAVVLGVSVADSVGGGELVSVPDTVRVLLAVAVPVALLLRDCVPEPVGTGDDVGVGERVFVCEEVPVRVFVVELVSVAVNAVLPEAVSVPEAVAEPLSVGVGLRAREERRLCGREAGRARDYGERGVRE